MKHETERQMDDILVNFDPPPFVSQQCSASLMIKSNYLVLGEAPDFS